MDFNQVLVDTTSRHIAATLRSVLEAVSSSLRLVVFRSPEHFLNRLLLLQHLLIVIDFSAHVGAASALLRHIQAHLSPIPFPVLAVAEPQSALLSDRALSSLTSDFVSPTALPSEWHMRLRSMLSLGQTQRLALSRLQFLASQVALATSSTRSRELATLSSLSRFIDIHTYGLDQPPSRLAEYVRSICAAMSLPQSDIDLFELASPLHDFGNIALSDSLLRRASPYSALDRAAIAQHPQIGHDLLRSFDSKYLQMASVIALTHHERFDGSGYPSGLCGNAIPLPGRIVAVADVFDAMTSSRRYRSTSITRDHALHHIRSQRSVAFDPYVVDAFLSTQTA